MDLLADVRWDVVGRFLAVALPVAVAFLGLIRGPGIIRSRLQHDVELLTKIPEGTNAHRSFENYLNGQIKRFAVLETEASRDWSGFIISALLVTALQAVAVWLMTVGTWYSWPPGIVVFIFGLAGMASMFDAAQRVPRDEKGNPRTDW